MFPFLGDARHFPLIFEVQLAYFSGRQCVIVAFRTLVDRHDLSVAV